MKNLLIISGSFFALLSAAAVAEPPMGMMPPPRTVSVSGQAEEQVAPDKAILSLSLISKNTKLAQAKQESDKLAETLVKAAKDLDIPKEMIAVSSINVSPEYSYNNRDGRPQFMGYIVSRTLRITMKTTDTYEKLFSAAIDAGVDQINGIEFELSDREARAGKVRVKAFEVAQAKAAALAAAAGMKLGKPLTINTDGHYTPPIMPMPMMAKAMMADAGGAESSVAPTLPGMVTLRESVSVVFELE